MAISVVVTLFFEDAKVTAQKEDSWTMVGNNLARTGSLKNPDLVANVSNWEFRWTDL
jgi:hypothetical protein